MTIRNEVPADEATIRSLITTAFKTAPRSGGNEADIVDALRASGSLTLSLVAEDGGEIVGHAAFSAVSINGLDVGWYGLGPVAVRADIRRRGFGRALIVSGVERIKKMGAKGCVVLGDPAFYGQLGFESDPNLRFGNLPVGLFQRLTFNGQPPIGVVAYHPAFYAN
jgi:putative acetyltransferase